jgi:hypothetical protein
MDRKVLALVVGQFVVIVVLGMKVHGMRGAVDDSPPGGVPAGRQQSAEVDRPAMRAQDRRAERAAAFASDATLPKLLDPAQARALLERNKQDTKNLAERAEKAHAIIQRLCQNGHVGEAWELIDAEYGLVRFRGLEAFFQQAKLTPGEALGYLEGLDGGDRGSALKGFFGSFDTTEFVALDLGSFKLDTPRERAALLGNLADRLRAVSDGQNADPQQVIALLAKATQMAKESMLSLDDLGSLLALDKTRDSFTRWATLDALPEGLRNTDRPYDGLQSNLIREMVIEDPERMMALTMEPGAPAGKFMHVAFEKWLDADNASAMQWYESRREGLNEDQQDRATAAFLRNSIRYGEYETALKWYDGFISPKWRSALSYAQRDAMNGMKKDAAKQQEGQ